MLVLPADPSRPEVHAQRQRDAPGPEARQHPGELKLRPQDLRLWAGKVCVQLLWETRLLTAFHRRGGGGVGVGVGAGVGVG